MSDIKERAYVSRLIMNVLTDTLCAREAILKFPVDHKDKSIRAAYHALVHREADEDLRRRDILYKEEQDDYLEMLANTLAKGEDLPTNVLRNYDKYYSDISLKDESGAKGLVQVLKKYLSIEPKD